MVAEPRQHAILREHFRWASRFALVWIVFTVLLFAGAGWVFDELGAPERLRAPAAVLLATIIIVHAIWISAGVAVSRLLEAAERSEMRNWGSGLR
jgi:uncharacterized membrane protein YhaH (DUF805 family)